MRVEDELDRLMKLVGDPTKTPKNDIFCQACGKPATLERGVCRPEPYRNITSSMLDRKGYLMERYR